jgi:hypothetical protein
MLISYLWSLPANTNVMPCPLGLSLLYCGVIFEFFIDIRMIQTCDIIEGRVGGRLCVAGVICGLWLLLLNDIDNCKSIQVADIQVK